METYIYLVLGLQVIILVYMVVISQQIKSIRNKIGTILALARIRRVQVNQQADQARGIDGDEFDPDGQAQGAAW